MKPITRGSLLEKSGPGLATTLPPREATNQQARAEVPARRTLLELAEPSP